MHSVLNSAHGRHVDYLITKKNIIFEEDSPINISATFSQNGFRIRRLKCDCERTRKEGRVDRQQPQSADNSSQDHLVGV